MPSLKSTHWISASLFAIAMGLVEAAVVVYLRRIYFPEGFGFPLGRIDLDLLWVELSREIATLIMLLTVAWLASRTPTQRLAYFLLCFGWWDLAYYGWLKVFLDWPSSLLTWDLLFLIPVVWSGPVLAPSLCALAMIVLALQRLHVGRGYNAGEWTGLSLGALLILWTFIDDGVRLGLWPLSPDPQRQQAMATYTPASYNWWLFSLGLGVILGAAISLFWRTGPQEQKETE